MTIYINNQPEEFSQPQSLTQILDKLQLQHTRGVAIAVNNQIISKTNWPEHLLRDNDKVTVIRATQGG
ncbi:MAG: sulfur carrier protein ThiS [Hymenobacteraceae bacterium]|nr:sulfur carrier protein ThiS [Hymenobacteraceae bacterium]MDX5395648.1 sulfur carrier protein ThiS [Hymenobacteraceae bacterium]MDX5443644.1 sulfur carrier protein ThiS [Hymenobacteraceae bacterium]MDX5511702.1 sulfur carrier protein ThiS [Hymenobacteraceae bacterium]